MEATDEDYALIKKITENGGRYYTASAIDRRPYSRLEELGWLTHFSPNISDVVYEIIKLGREAAAKR